MYVNVVKTTVEWPTVERHINIHNGIVLYVSHKINIDLVSILIIIYFTRQINLSKFNTQISNHKYETRFLMFH